MSAGGNPSAASAPPRYRRVRAWHFVEVLAHTAVEATVSGSRPWKVTVASCLVPIAPLLVRRTLAGSGGIVGVVIGPPRLGVALLSPVWPKPG
jgi:hypothetical protein